MTQRDRDMLDLDPDDATRALRMCRAQRRASWQAPVLLWFGFALLLGYLASVFLGANRQVIAAEVGGATPAVVELFTSQGCYSCPPAEALLGELITDIDPDYLVALEFHVDYWDTLVYGRHGSHKDPFSSPTNTLRQRDYNGRRLSGQRGVYTPQMVVNGRYGAVGSRRGDVLDGINRVERPALDLRVTAAGESMLSVGLEGDVAGLPDDAQVWLAVFDIKATTEIATGENHDKTLTSHHIVRRFEPVSPASAAQFDLTVALEAGQGCALLVQSPDLGPIHGAAYCPDSIWRPTEG
ncbi:MAG: DUF1223 domain-containing protein [Pseudomonadota bacterium]